MNKLFMAVAVEHANCTSRLGIGGPFGAVIVDKNGDLVALSSNSVISDKDPTAHAEINAIRRACRVLNTYDLSGCTLYATGYPCPMCMSAIIWANIKKVYYGTTIEQADEILGFRDEDMYEQLKNPQSVVILEQIGSDLCLNLFQNYSQHNGVIY